MVKSNVEKAFSSREVLKAVYHSILKREPDADGILAYSALLEQPGGLEATITSLLSSKEFSQININNKEIIFDIYKALLNREPDAEGLKTYEAELNQSMGLEATIASIISSKEFINNITNSKEVITSIYKSLLKREPDAEGLKKYEPLLREPGGLEHTINSILSSAEFHGIKEFLGTKRNAFVFLHVQKSGGTSIHRIFENIYGREVYLEHGDSLGQLSKSKLFTYVGFMGHFNYDSIKFLPHDALTKISFLREPKSRLVSAYRFWNAHEPCAPGYGTVTALANQFSPVAFFNLIETGKLPEVWNHMTWTIMGEALWHEWREMLNERERDQEEVVSICLPAIRRRLSEFSMIGLYEDYERSVQNLCQLLGVRMPAVIPKSHSLTSLTSSEPHLKRSPIHVQLTAELSTLLEKYTALDEILYREAVRLHAQY